ncbi:MAG TPA: ribosome maturation factor RimM [Candidatus Margulisiibacteriota bacterium]|nr:ribosome maturation factor RimM [Candidatus Margulisiibacteriota bacterium]
MAAATLIALGEIVNTHATHGELRVRLFNPASTALTAGARVVLRRGTQELERRIVGVRPHKRLLLLTLEACDSMSAAEALVGCEVCVSEDDLPPASPDELYHYQLLGMTVVTTAGAEIGVVTEVLALGSNDVCVVRADEREHLIPLIADVVRHIDRADKRLVIDPLPGLLDV